MSKWTIFLFLLVIVFRIGLYVQPTINNLGSMVLIMFCCLVSLIDDKR